jgi:ATP-binding cassette subfamily F protein 3
MPLLTVANLRHAYGTQVVLDGVGLSIEPGEKIGLVGRNGTGKTTLMHVLRGRLTPDEGDVQRQRGARVGYLSQDPDLDPKDTVRDAAEGAFDELHALHVRQHELFEQMASAEGAQLDRLLRQQSEVEAGIEAAGGYAIDHRIDATLHGLGFTDAQFGLKVAHLSGGQKGRLGLARLLLEEPDLLLLDEPTNHLDIAGRRWLETFLAQEYGGAVLVVSHDRWLLDRVVSRILEVERGGLQDYPGNYHRYTELRRERQLTMARAHDKQQDHIRREQQFIRRYKAGQRSKQARGRETRLERFKQGMLERPIELEVMNLNLPPARRSGEQVIVAEGIAKRYDQLTLFEDLDLDIRRGDRVGIIGPNGAGKTTLVQCLLGEITPDAGRVRLGSRVSVGYYHQLHEGLDLSLTVWQYLQSVIVGLDGQARASEQQARDLAGAFLFSGEEQEKHLVDVSGGERSRAVLAGLVAGAHNLLVLDEPSNHLDIPSAERLEAVLDRRSGYEGALLQSTCDKQIVCGDTGRARWFEGTYMDWEQRERQEQARPEESRPRSAPAPRRPPAAAPDPANPLASLSMQKLEQRIESLESEIRRIDRDLLDPAVYSDGPRCKALQARRAEVQADLRPIETEWSRRAEGQ